MPDFVSSFWSWFIIVLTVISIAGVLWLVRWMSATKAEAGAEPEPMGHVWDEDLQELNNPLPRWWLNMFYITLAFGVIYLILYPGLGSFGGVLGWSSKDRYEREVQAADKRFGPLYEKYLQEDLRTLVHDQQAMKTGARLFFNYCTVCHGSDAGGTKAKGYPSLKDGDWLYGGGPEQIKTSIMHGRNGVMPPWEAALGRDGVFNVSEYVLSLSGRKVNINAAQAGKEKFKQLCVSCHGVDGKGDQKQGAPNLTDNIWLHGGSQKTIMETIAGGRQGRMPAHKEFLGEAKVHLLAAYIYSLSAANLNE